MSSEEMKQVLGHEPMTFEQMIQAMQLQHDWEALRNQAAIAAMHGILGNIDLIHKICIENSLKSFNGKVIANVAVQYADALVQELKGNYQ